MPHPPTAPFLVFEGVDGCGKSTQAQLTANWLQQQGYTVTLTREPGGTALAEHVRALLLDPAIPCVARAELLLMLAARAQHVAERILPAVQSGTIVISDRFSLSSLAYQGYGRGVPLEDIRVANAVATAGLAPDVTLLIDVPLDGALARIGERQDRFEGEGRGFLQRVIDGYHALASHDASIRTIDGTGTIQDVQCAIREVLQPLLTHYKSTGGVTL